MKKCLLLLGFMAATIAVKAQTGTVILSISGIRLAKGGEISAGLFRRENFPKVGKQYMGTENPVTANTMRITFAQVPVGEYGVVAFQDINRDKKLAANFVGYPTEPIGFANGASISFGPPDFDEAKIRVESGKTITVAITLK